MNSSRFSRLRSSGNSSSTHCVISRPSQAGSRILAYRHRVALHPSLVLAVGALLAVFRLLACRAAAVGTGDVLLFLGFCLDLSLGWIAALATPSEGNAVL